MSNIKRTSVHFNKKIGQYRLMINQKNISDQKSIYLKLNFLLTVQTMLNLSPFTQQGIDLSTAIKYLI